MSQGGSFLDGFEDGAFSGAVGGAIGGTAFAGLGVAGSALGKEISCVSKLGKVIKATAAVSKVLSLGMAGVDMISLADMAIDNKNNPIADLNKKLHSNKAYNVFQISVSALAVFTGGMTTTMKCFVAGTLVLTIDGLRKIEDIEVGDRVLAADTDTMERKYKEVLDTFVRKTNDLIHIFIGEEEIVTTTDHPFWVKGKGFVPAMNLVIGSELINDNGHAICVENILRESSHDGVEVFNFKVEDYHTYYVGKNHILVHNADYSQISAQEFQSEFKERAKKSGLSESDINNAIDAFNNEDYQKMASFFDTSTKKDGAVFWSGNKQGAMDYAANNNRTMLEQTPGGQVFDGWNSLSKVLPDWDAGKNQAKPLWEALSKQYANGAEGSVKYVHPDGYIGNVFKTIEQPILLDKIGKGIVQFEEIVL